jgi:hypothetical protein
MLIAGRADCEQSIHFYRFVLLETIGTAQISCMIVTIHAYPQEQSGIA